MIETIINSEVLDNIELNLEEEEQVIPTTFIHNNIPIEIKPGKKHNVNPKLTPT